jgi:hypothetical protein
MTESTIEIIIACYLEDDWEYWRALCSDGNEFFSVPFKDWQQGAVREFAELRSQGKPCRFVAVRYDTFFHWSTLNNRSTDSQARAEFARTQAAFAPLVRNLH